MMVRKSGYPPLLDGFIIHIFHYFSYQLAISWVYAAMFYSLEGGLGPWRKAMLSMVTSGGGSFVATYKMVYVHTMKQLGISTIDHR